MISINNSVTNVLGSPAMISDTIANRPDGKDVAIGSIFVAIDTGNMYQSDGTTWYSIGGGTGTTLGIDSVLAVSQLLTNNRSINTNGFVFGINSGSDAMLQLNFDYQILGNLNTSYVRVKQDTYQFLTGYNNVNRGIVIDFFNKSYLLGE